MKNKVFTVVLLLIVLTIWAKVFLKFKGNLFQEKSANQYSEKGIDIKLVVKDTISLKLNYPDPFLSFNIASPIIETKVEQIDITTRQTNLIQPRIKYIGRIKRTDASAALGIININGDILYVRKNEIVEGFKVIEMERDYITFKDKANKLIFYRD